MKKRFSGILRYLALFFAIAVLACSLEYLAGLVPQEAMRKNLLASMDQLKSEGLTPGILYDGHPRSKLDNMSENYILTYSYYMNTREEPLSFLTNPGRLIRDPHEELFAQTEELLEQQLPSDMNYARYFMGFRIYVRPLLAVMNYMDARQCIQWGFFLLLGAVMLMLYRRTGSAAFPMAFCFAISQMNPVAVSACFQYSICFYIAMIGMLLVPRTGKRFPLPMLMLAIGMATLIFDFYTAPLLTFGLPMMTALLIDGSESAPASSRTVWRRVGVAAAAWAAGYFGAWLFKMLATTLLTDQNALESGFTRLLYWASAEEMSGTPHLAMKAIFYNLINIVDIVPLLAEGGLLIVWLICFVRNPARKDAFLRNLPYLALAFLPFLWFAVAAAPSYGQAYFQYRSLVMFLFGGLIFLVRTAGWDTPRIQEISREMRQK